MLAIELIVDIGDKRSFSFFFASSSARLSRSSAIVSRISFCARGKRLYAALFFGLFQRFLNDPQI